MKKIFLVSFLLITIGCGSGKNEDHFKAAWLLFETNQLDLAHQAFTALLVEDEEANVGLGWTTLRMGMDSLSAADRYFGLVSEGDFTDAFAGSTITKWHLTQFSASLTDAQKVLTADSAYTFTHDTSVNYIDILQYKAMSQFHLNDLAGCIQTIKKLDPGFTATVADPNIKQTLLDKMATFN